MLKIYSSKKWLQVSQQHTIILYPFWGKIQEDKTDPDFGRFDEYINNGVTLFNLVPSIDEATFAVYPTEFNPQPTTKNHVTEIASICKQVNKKLIVFYNADDDKEYKIDNVVFFRTSFYKSTQDTSSFSFPGWSVDFINYFKDKLYFPLNSNTPSVSYCGYVDYYIDNSILNSFKSFFSDKRNNKENLAKCIRGKACRTIKKNPSIQSNFIIRNGFWAQGINDKINARIEYASNIINSLYGIATRGGGNFSYRLYEILSCGRIPVFINTDCVLPFDTIIDWKKHVIWVEEN